MKKHYLFFLFLSLLSSISGLSVKGQDSVSIMGQLMGTCDFTSLKLSRFNVNTQGDENIPINKYGYFSIYGPLDAARQMTLTSNHFRYDFFISPSTQPYRFSITCLENGDYNIKLEDSPENDAFNLLSRIQQSLVKDCASIIQSNSNADSARLQIEQYFAIHNSNLKRIKHSYPNSITAQVLAPACELPTRLPKHELIDSLVHFVLHNPGWNNLQCYNTDLLLSSISLAQKFINQNDDSAKKHFVDLLLNNRPVNDTVAKLYQQVIFDFFLFQQDESSLRFYADWARTNENKMANIGQGYKMKKMENMLPGSPLIEVQLKDSSGTEKSLMQVAKSNKYTILLFWSVTCDHCRQELPHLISFYKKYHEKGVEIFAVAIDSEKDQWQKFITEQHLNWINVFQPEDRADFAGAYMVTYTPTLVLCDSSGKILSRYGSLKSIENIIK